VVSCDSADERYDKLLEHFDTAHGAQATTYGVGMSISIEYVSFVSSGLMLIR